MKKKIVAILTMGAMVLSLAACGGAAASSTAEAASEAASEVEEAAEEVEEEVEEVAEDAEEAVEEVEAEVEEAVAADDMEGGFAEFPIDDITDIEAGGLFNVSGVYFQPVPMSGGFENYEDFDLHLEADILLLPDNGLGFAAGEKFPYMTVDYELTPEEGDAIVGTFMPMSADDGFHYGANIKMGEAGTYHVKFTINNPAENGYLIHLDDETGPGKSLDDYEWPMVVEGDWEYVPQEW